MADAKTSATQPYLVIYVPQVPMDCSGVFTAPPAITPAEAPNFNRYSDGSDPIAFIKLAERPGAHSIIVRDLAEAKKLICHEVRLRKQIEWDRRAPGG